MTYGTDGFRIANGPARAGRFGSFWQGLRQRRTQRLAIARLEHLDEHLLRDIGITRAGIADRVRGG